MENIKWDITFDIMKENTIWHSESMESLVWGFLYKDRYNEFVWTIDEIIKDVEERMALWQWEEPYWLKDLKLRSEK